MTPLTTPAELTLLGLLLEEPRHGYEIEEVITERGMRQWTEIGFSSIYYLLKKLRDRGLIAETSGPRSATTTRKVYVTTPAGRAECAKAVEAAIAEVRPVFPALLVGLANQPAVPAGRLEIALAQRARALTEQVKAVREAADAQTGSPVFVRAIFDYTFGQLEAEQNWLTHYRTKPAGENAP